MPCHHAQTDSTTSSTAGHQAGKSTNHEASPARHNMGVHNSPTMTVARKLHHHLCCYIADLLPAFTKACTAPSLIEHAQPTELSALLQPSRICPCCSVKLSVALLQLWVNITRVWPHPFLQDTPLADTILPVVQLAAAAVLYWPSTEVYKELLLQYPHTPAAGCVCLSWSAGVLAMDVMHVLVHEMCRAPGIAQLPVRVAAYAGLQVS